MTNNKLPTNQRREINAVDIALLLIYRRETFFKQKNVTGKEIWKDCLFLQKIEYDYFRDYLPIDIETNFYRIMDVIKTDIKRYNYSGPNIEDITVGNMDRIKCGSNSNEGIDWDLLEPRFGKTSDLDGRIKSYYINVLFSKEAKSED